MKNSIICVFIGAILFTVLLFTCGCNRYCDPANISNGSSNSHHDQKKFKASIRIMRVQQYGPFCKVRYANMKYITDRLYENCDCGKFEVGKWVNEDSI